MKKFFVLDRVTGMTLVLIPLIYVVVGAVLFGRTELYSDTVRGMVIGGVMSKLLPDIISFYFESTAAQDKKDNPPAPSTTTTTTTSGTPPEIKTSTEVKP